jgi:hypothetical protein
MAVTSTGREAYEKSSVFYEPNALLFVLDDPLPAPVLFL